MSSVRPLLTGKNSRLFLLVLSEANLLLGALFFVQPGEAIGIWPWTVKPLAVRFLGAIFIAITLGCWSALRAKVWQRGKILVLVGAVFFGLSAIISLSVAVSQPAILSTWAWTFYFFAASIGLFAVLKIHGWYRGTRDMIGLDSSWKLARPFFRIQTAVVGIFATFMLFTPELALEQMWPWDVTVSTLQIFAALFLATSMATAWGSLQTEKKRIQALLPLDAVFPALALLAVAIHWNVIVAESPSSLVSGVWVFLYSFVAVGSTFLFFASRAKEGP